MNRRNFLICGFAAPGFAVLPGSTASASNRRIPIGVLGAVHSHADAKIRILKNSPDWKLIGICENDTRVRSAHASSDVPFLSQKELLARAEVIAVESDVADHAQHAAVVLTAGKHLHLEKPPATSLEEFSKIVHLANQRNLLLQLGYMWRYNPGINRALEAARRGWLGEVYLIRGTINNQLSATRRPEWARFQGGVMFELGSHLIDVLVRLQGKPVRVQSILRNDGPSSDGLSDNTVAVFEFSRSLGIITAATLQPGAGPHRSFEVMGDKGTAVVSPIEPPQLLLDLAEAAGPYRAGINKVEVPAYRRYVDDFAELAAAVRQEQPLAVSPEQELLVQETLMRAIQAPKGQ